MHTFFNLSSAVTSPFTIFQVLFSLFVSAKFGLYACLGVVGLDVKVSEYTFVFLISPLVCTKVICLYDQTKAPCIISSVSLFLLNRLYSHF